MYELFLNIAMSLNIVKRTTQSYPSESRFYVFCAIWLLLFFGKINWKQFKVQEKKITLDHLFPLVTKWIILVLFFSNKDKSPLKVFSI